jgi:PAS domain S-box-containing protein
VAVGGAGRIIYVNPAAEALLGRSASDMLGRDAQEVVSARGGGNVIPPPGEVEGMTGEVDLVLPDGTELTVDVRLSVLELEDDERGVVAILTDRTELKRAEQEARTKDRLASLGELTAGVAHEIRNPLAGIGASAQLLRSRLGAEDERTRLLDLILDEVTRLDRIVENMLGFARPSRPSLRLEEVPGSLDRALTLVEEEAKQAGIDIERRVAEDLPRVWIDPDQMQQVFLNLLRNAIQAMEGSGGTLRVTIRKVARRPYLRRRAGRRRDDGGRLPPEPPSLMDWVEVEVTDSGHGVTREALERVFNPFYTTRKTGTGLGLSITQAIVHEHGGMISLTSEPGRGTTVLVDLPQDKRRGQRRSPA